MQAAPGRPARGGGPFREALVFMIGGGNYLEYESLVTWAGRATPPKSIVYGATDLLSGEQVCLRSLLRARWHERC